MADRLIRIGDLARAMIAAGATPTRSPARLAEMRIDIRALVGAEPDGDAIWGLRLRQPPAPRFDWFARFRRARRRRTGWEPRRLTLCWTPNHLDAAIDGRSIARIPLSTAREGE